MNEDDKACLVCGEAIKAVAIKCRFCSTDLVAFAAMKQAEIEQDLFVGHPAIIYSASQFLIVVLVPFLIFAIGAVAMPDHRIALTLLVSAISLGVIYLYFYLKSRRIHYRITTQRIKVRRGLLSKVQESLELFRIDHFEFRQPLGSRLVGQSFLHLFSSDAELISFTIFAIPNLETVAEQLRECQLKERVRRSLTTFVKA